MFVLAIASSFNGFLVGMAIGGLGFGVYVAVDLALGYVTARLVECTFVAIGIGSLLSILTLREDFTGAAGGDAGAFVTVGKSLVAIHDWTFLLGPGFIVGVGNGLILGWLMYRSGLVPRGMALLGLIAGPSSALAGSPCCSASSSRTPR